MEWLNLHVSILSSADFLCSESVERGVWLSLLHHCVRQENGGVISGAGAWTDRQWQQICAVRLRDVAGDHRLWRWSGNDITVIAYPLAQQEEAQRRRRERLLMPRHRSSYAVKLGDPRWQKKRLRIFERDDWACRRCSATDRQLQVHHLRYERGREPWEYPDETLETLCDECHGVLSPRRAIDGW